MRLSGQFQACLLFFFMKRFDFARTKSTKRFLLVITFVHAKSFREKKMNGLEIVLIISFYYTTHIRISKYKIIFAKGYTLQIDLTKFF